MFYCFARNLLWIIFKILFPFKVAGVENISSSENYVICGNHKSNLDPIMIGISIPTSIYYMAKEELFKTKFLNMLMRNINAFPVKRGGNDVSAIKSALEIVKNKGSLVMFPEGTRNRTGKLGKGKTGVAMIALKSKALVLPVGICGNYKFFRRIMVKIGKPIDLSEYHDKKLNAQDYQSITDNIIMKNIAMLLEK